MSCDTSGKKVGACRVLTRIRPGSVSVYQGMQSQGNPESGTAWDRCSAGGNEQYTDGRVRAFEHEVNRTVTIVHEIIEDLSRHCPEHARGGAASKELQRIRPHVEGALAALAAIEDHRELTQSELSRRRAFRMLLEGTARG